MREKILYEKKYRRLAEQAQCEIPGGIKSPYTDAEAFCQRILQETVYVVLPDRIENTPYFIKLAIQIGEELQIDTSVTEYENHVSVAYALEKGIPYPSLTDVAELADEVYFNNDERSVLVSFDYYTRAAYRGGKCVFPSNYHGTSGHP